MTARRIGLRTRLTAYILLLNLIFAGGAGYLIFANRARPGLWAWLLVAECMFAALFWVGLRIVGSIFGTLDLISTGAEYMHDRDFTSRFTEVGHPEMDRLVGIYNRMIDNLREERTRLQEQHFFLVKVMEASPSGMIALDFEGRVSMANPAAGQILQLESQSIIGTRLDQIASPLAAELSGLGAGESRIVATAGGRRLKCRRSSFIDRGFARDFFLIEELTEELRQAEKAAYEKVIRYMSHEVNNSIGSANSLLHSSLHYAGQIKPEDRHDFEMALNVAINRTEHLNQFLKHFADVFRLPPPEMKTCRIVELIDETLWLFKAECEGRRIEVRRETADPELTVSLDRRQMGQALLNIVRNAIEAIGENGTITVVLGRSGHRDFLAIEDTGCGIPKKIQENLFTPFFSTKEKGHGIGLTLVQEILDQHGFEFSLTSRHNEPTRFTIHFGK